MRREAALRHAALGLSLALGWALGLALGCAPKGARLSSSTAPPSAIPADPPSSDAAADPSGRIALQPCEPGPSADLRVHGWAQLDWCNLDFGLEGRAFEGGASVPAQGDGDTQVHLRAVFTGELDEGAAALDRREEAVAIVELGEGETRRSELHLFRRDAAGVHHITVVPVPPVDAESLEVHVNEGVVVHQGRDPSGRDCTFVLRWRPPATLVSEAYRCAPLGATGSAGEGAGSSGTAGAASG